MFGGVEMGFPQFEWYEIVIFVAVIAIGSWVGIELFIWFIKWILSHLQWV